MDAKEIPKKCQMDTTHCGDLELALKHWTNISKDSYTSIYNNNSCSDVA